MSVADVAEVTYDDAGGVRWAILAALRAPAADVARVVLADLRGHRVVTDDDEIVASLVAAGGVVRRRAHDYEFDLARVPPEWSKTPAPQGFALSRTLDPVALAPAKDAANPPGHPDHEPGMDHVADLRQLLSGEVIGPIVPEATWQVAGPEGPCGAVIVCDRPVTAPGQRTWVLDVFVHPRLHGRGLGGLLLRRSLAGAARAGYTTTGLVVSDGNPARRAYEALGFRHLRSGTSVDVP